MSLTCPVLVSVQLSVCLYYAHVMYLFLFLAKLRGRGGMLYVALITSAVETQA